MENASTFQQPTSGPAHRPVRRHQPIVGPAVLITLGLVFLGQNVGMLPADTWLNLWRFWPVLLILGGVEIIFGHSSLGPAIGTFFFVAFVFAVVGAFTFVGQVGSWSSMERPFGAVGVVATDHISRELGDSSRAIIDLDHGAGRLDVTALPSTSLQLIEADLSYSQSAMVDRQIEGRGDATYVRLKARNEYHGFPMANGFRQDWMVKLSPNVPVELRVHSGASGVSMDLSDLKVTNLNVDSGASGVDITLPRAAGRTDARVQAGAAGVHIRVRH